MDPRQWLTPFREHNPGKATHVPDRPDRYALAQTQPLQCIPNLEAQYESLHFVRHKPQPSSNL